jgi:type II secretion system protein I
MSESLRDGRGFTLIELLVSLAILAVALAVLFGAISASLDRTRKERDETLAASLVQSLLARADGEGAIAPGERSGVYSNGFHWRVVIRTQGNDDDIRARHVSAYLVRAIVSWRDGGQDWSRSLTALRLSPQKPPA